MQARYLLILLFSLALAGCGGPSQEVRTNSEKTTTKAKKKSFVESAQLTERKIEVKKAPTYIPGIDHTAQDLFRKGVEDILAKKVDYEKAKREFEKSIKEDPKFLEAYFNLGMVYEREGNPDKALKIYESAMKANPDSLDAKAYIGKIYLAKAKKAGKLGRMAEAKQWETKAMNLFDQVIAKNPDNVAAQNAIALYWLMKGDRKAASKYVKAVLMMDPHNVVALNTRGLINYLAGKYRIARWLFEQKALKEDPNSTEAWNNLGLVYMKIHDVPKAVECFVQSLKMNASNSAAMMNLAAIYLNYLNYEGAYNLYQKVLTMDRENPEALIGMGTSILGMHKPKEALKYYTEALKVKPGLFILYKKMGMLYETSLNDMQKAIDNYEKYIAGAHPGPNDEVVMKVTALKQMMQMQAPKPEPAPAPAATPDTSKPGETKPAADTNAPKTAKPAPTAPKKTKETKKNDSKGGKK